ncbi:MAG: tRNA lysidine(34) synthetase TilS [Proteobacteria bacterium]|nr:tRNA lysidine(34) synthetase TilS [Pseudomonadota bacterium]
MQIINFPDLDKAKGVAVGVSGGADSMALLHMLSNYAVKRGKNFKVLALTVDHGLRKSSKAEAAKVAAWVKNWPQVTHKTLRWVGQKPKTGLMEAARAARYTLLFDACSQSKIKMLAVAHHADDQAETFFMRLAHGSGLDGLAGMRTITKGTAKVLVYRPLLNVSHDDLVAYCRKHKIKWLEDPTNSNDAFSRARLRKALAKEGLSSKRLVTTIRRLANASMALEEMAGDAAAGALLKSSSKMAVYDFKKLASHPLEIFLRILKTTIEKLGKSGYGPRLERLEEMACALQNAKTCTRVTIGGCFLEAHPRKNTLTIRQEKS